MKLSESEKTKLRQVRDAIHAREAEYWKLLKDAFPPGSEVEWSRGGHPQKGIVKWVAHDRFCVYNLKTEQDVQIRDYNILGC